MQSAVERRQSILELMCERRHETIDNLAFEFGVDRRTIRRDIEVLSISYPLYTFIARELGMTAERLRKQLVNGEIFTYEESRLLMAMFGAEAMLPVIDWRGVNVCRTAG